MKVVIYKSIITTFIQKERLKNKGKGNSNKREIPSPAE